MRPQSTILALVAGYYSSIIGSTIFVATEPLQASQGFRNRGPDKTINLIQGEDPTESLGAPRLQARSSKPWQRLLGGPRSEGATPLLPARPRLTRQERKLQKGEAQLTGREQTILDGFERERRETAYRQKVFEYIRHRASWEEVEAAQAHWHALIPQTAQREDRVWLYNMIKRSTKERHTQNGRAKGFLSRGNLVLFESEIGTLGRDRGKDVRSRVT